MRDDPVGEVLYGRRSDGVGELVAPWQAAQAVPTSQGQKPPELPGRRAPVLVRLADVAPESIEPRAHSTATLLASMCSAPSVKRTMTALSPWLPTYPPSKRLSRRRARSSS